MIYTRGHVNRKFSIFDWFFFLNNKIIWSLSVILADYNLHPWLLCAEDNFRMSSTHQPFHERLCEYLVRLPWRWPQVRCTLRGRTAAARCRPGCRASCGCTASSPARSRTSPARTPPCRAWWAHAGSRWCRLGRTWHTRRRVDLDCIQYLTEQETIKFFILFFKINH